MGNSVFEFTLVMSAAINPNGMAGINEKSGIDRERQYIRTLRFYTRQDTVKFTGSMVDCLGLKV